MVWTSLIRDLLLLNARNVKMIQSITMNNINNINNININHHPIPPFPTFRSSKENGCCLQLHVGISLAASQQCLNAH